MLIIGERINSTRASVRKAIDSRDTSFIVSEGLRQIESGASALDVNCAMGLENELQDLDWVISVLQNEFPEIGICVDSPNYQAVEAALKAYKGKGALFINSITAERGKAEEVFSLALNHSAHIIALTMDDNGMPDDAEERTAIAEKIIAMAKRGGVPENKLFFDPLVRPASTEQGQARAFLDSIPQIKRLGDVRTICGLSNVSFGLPKRSLVNATFLSMALYCGLDACILDPIDKYIGSSIKTSEVLLGKDEFCSSYIGSFRQGALI